MKDIFKFSKVRKMENLLKNNVRRMCLLGVALGTKLKFSLLNLDLEICFLRKSTKKHSNSPLNFSLIREILIIFDSRNYFPFSTQIFS